MNVVIYIIAAPIFLMSLAAHIFVKLRLRPKGDDFDDYYEEFEHFHPAYARYTRWSTITFTTATIAALLLFIAAVI